MTNGPLCGKASPSPELSPSDNVTQYFPHIRSINSLFKVSIIPPPDTLLGIDTTGI